MSFHKSILIQNLTVAQVSGFTGSSFPYGLKGNLHSWKSYLKSSILMVYLHRLPYRVEQGNVWPSLWTVLLSLWSSLKSKDLAPFVPCSWLGHLKGSPKSIFIWGKSLAGGIVSTLTLSGGCCRGRRRERMICALQRPTQNLCLASPPSNRPTLCHQHPEQTPSFDIDRLWT